MYTVNTYSGHFLDFVRSEIDNLKTLQSEKLYTMENENMQSLSYAPWTPGDPQTPIWEPQSSGVGHLLPMLELIVFIDKYNPFQHWEIC